MFNRPMVLLLLMLLSGCGDIFVGSPNQNSFNAAKRRWANRPFTRYQLRARYNNGVWGGCEQNAVIDNEQIVEITSGCRQACADLPANMQFIAPTPIVTPTRTPYPLPLAPVPLPTSTPLPYPSPPPGDQQTSPPDLRPSDQQTSPPAPPLAGPTLPPGGDDFQQATPGLPRNFCFAPGPTISAMFDLFEPYVEMCDQSVNYDPALGYIRSAQWVLGSPNGRPSADGFCTLVGSFNEPASIEVLELTPLP